MGFEGSCRRAQGAKSVRCEVSQGSVGKNPGVVIRTWTRARKKTEGGEGQKRPRQVRGKVVAGEDGASLGESREEVDGN